jgi:hypothetical protein
MFTWLLSLYTAIVGWIRFTRFTAYGLYLLYLELDIPFKLKSLLNRTNPGKRTNAQIPLTELIETIKQDYIGLREQNKVHPEKNYAIITGYVVKYDY